MEKKDEESKAKAKHIFLNLIYFLRKKYIFFFKKKSFVFFFKENSQQRSFFNPHCLLTSRT